MRWYRLRLVGLIGFLSVGIYAFAAPVDPLQNMPDGVLYLELVLNQKSSNQVVPVRFAKGHFYVKRVDLQGLGLKIQGLPDEEIAADSVVNVRYDGNTQQLLLTVATDQLPQQYIEPQQKEERYPPVSDLGALVNYDTYLSLPQKSNGRYVTIWTEPRVFGRFGVLSNTGVYRHDMPQAVVNSSKQGYLRYDTQWRYSDENQLLTYQAGDVITGALPWSGAVRLGGVQIARNFTLRSDLVTYPLPQFAGQAAIPSAVDLFINNYKVGSTQVDPGPFTMETTPFINGAGQATVVVTDAQGRKVSTSIPFYVTSQLLKQGLVDYSLSVGMIRQDYGVRSFSYGQKAGSGILRYGLTDFVTIEGQAEGASGLQVGGMGLGTRLGLLGVLNVAHRYSRADTNAFLADSLTDSVKGEQFVFGYSYSTGHFSVAAQRALRSKGFMDLGAYRSHFSATRRSDTLSVSLNLGQVGSLGMGYFATQDMKGNQTRLANLSYNSTLGKSINLYAAVNRAIGAPGYSAQLQIMIPLDKMGSVSNSVSRDTKGKVSGQVNYSRSVPSDGGLGWNLLYGHNEGSYQQGNLTWRNPYFQAQGGVYGNPGGRSAWGDLAGSMVMMDGTVYAANQVNDAFALVSAEGYPEVPVYYENQKIGVTNSNGYVFVPSVPSYYPAKFAIDSLGLPVNVQLPTTEKRVAIKTQSGTVVRFPIKKVYSVSFVLQDEQAQVLARGSLVRLKDASYQTYVGWDGLVYLEGVAPDNKIEVILPDQTRCHASFKVDIKAEMPARLSPLQCVLNTNKTEPTDPNKGTS